MTKIEDFRKALVTILEGVSKTQLPEDKYFKEIIYEGGFLCFPQEIAASYQTAVKILRIKSDRSGKLISDKTLERKR